MSDWAISEALALAQLQATLARLSAAPGPARLLLYATPAPAGDAPVAIAPDAQASLALANPPGQITAGVLKLSATPAMVMRQGVPLWGLLVAGDGQPLARGEVSGATGDGAIRVSGGAIAPGASAPTLYPGALVALAETFLS